MLRRRRGIAVPAQLRIVVRVNVDEARRQRLSARVDLDLTGALEPANRDYPVPGDREIPVKGGLAGSIDDVGVTDDERKHGQFPNLCVIFPHDATMATR